MDSLINQGYLNQHEFYSRNSPGLLIFILDQTASTQLLSKSSKKSIAELITNEANDFIHDLIISNARVEGIRDTCFMKIFGANDNDFKLIGDGWLSQIANNPIRIEEKKRLVRDLSGNTIEIIQSFPIWFEVSSIGIAPNDFSLIQKELNNWHCNKPKHYPASTIVLYCEDDAKRMKLNNNVFFNDNFEEPKVYEKLFR